MELRLRLERILKETMQKQEEIHVLREQQQLLREQITELEKQLETEKTARNLLEEQNKIAKIANVYELDRTDKTALKKLINQYVKEIDRCIALLNEH